MSKKVYCIAKFKAKHGCDDELFKTLQSLESDSLREDGCLQYIVTRAIKSSYATGNTSFNIVFNEIWQDIEHFEAHCEREAIKEFFDRECLSKDGLVEEYDVTIYSDEPDFYDKAELGSTK